MKKIGLWIIGFGNIFLVFGKAFSQEAFVTDSITICVQLPDFLKPEFISKDFLHFLDKRKPNCDSLNFVYYDRFITSKTNEIVPAYHSIHIEKNIVIHNQKIEIKDDSLMVFLRFSCRKKSFLSVNLKSSGFCNKLNYYNFSPEILKPTELH